MKTKEKKAKGKGKAIIGIALAAIMLASVMAAMVTPAAAFVRDARAVIPTAAPTGPVVVIGELINFPPAMGVTQIQYATSDGMGGYIATGQVLCVTAAGTIDTTEATTAGVYIATLTAAPGVQYFLTLTDAVLKLTLQRGGAAISNVVAGQVFAVVGDTNIPLSGYTIPPLAATTGYMNDIKLTMLEGSIETNAGVQLPLWSAVGAVFLDEDLSNSVTPGDLWAWAVRPAGTVIAPVGVPFRDVDGSGTITAGDVFDPTGTGILSTVGYLVSGALVVQPHPIDGAPSPCAASVTAAAWALHDGTNVGNVIGALDLGDIATTTAGGTAYTVLTGVGGLPAGDYTIRVETYTTGNARAAIDIRSTDNDLTVRTQEISVEADVTEQTTGNDVVLTITAGATVGVTVQLSGASGVFDVTKGDYPTRALAGSDANTFIAWIPSDGTLTAVITSSTPGVVTVRAFVTADPTVTDTTEVRFKELQTTVEVSTDKEEYSPGDVMNTSIHLSNPTDDTQKLLFKWYLGIPEYDLWAEMAATPVTLPAGYDKTFTVPIPVGNWGRESFCGCHAVSLTDTTTRKVVSVDSAAWIYTPGAVSESKAAVEIAKEITKEIGRVELPS